MLATRALLPLGFLLALLQAELVTGRALRTLLERLATRPSAEQWRDTIADALDDPDLRLGYRDPELGGTVRDRRRRAGSACRSIATLNRSPRRRSTKRWPRTPRSCARLRQPRCRRSRTARSRACCIRRGPGSWKSGARSGGGSGETSMTAPGRAADPSHAHC